MASHTVPYSTGIPPDQHKLDEGTRQYAALKIEAKKPRVVVAIPAFNEEVAIGSVVLRSRKYADEVIVIDDGSNDSTAEIARLAGARLIIHNNNKGKGVGIRDAFIYAKMVNADILVLIDGDGQHDPDEIPKLLRPILEKEADLANGSRFLIRNGNKIPKYRRLGQEILTLVTNTGTKKNITDTQNGFRAFSKNTFGCFSFNQNGMAIESEMLMDAANAGVRIKEVPIGVRYDLQGSTFNPLTHGFGVLNKVIGLVSQRRPILFYCLPGAAMVLLGAWCIFMLLSVFNSTHSLAVEYGIGSILFIIPGIVLISNGLMLVSFHSISVRH